MTKTKIKNDLDYKLVFNKLHDSVFIYDLGGKILSVNSAACSKLGYSREELQNMHVADIDSPEFRELMPERVKSLRKNGEAIFESAHVARSGRIIPIEVRSSIIEIDDNPAVLNIVRDITEQKKAVEDRENLLRVKTIVSEVSSLLVSTDNFDDSVNKILEIIGNSCGADRICLSKLNPDKTGIEITHNWYKNGKKNTKLIPPEIYSFWKDRLNSGKIIQIDNISDLGDEFVEVKELLESANIMELLVLPLLDAANKTSGFLGFFKETASDGCYTDNVQELSTLSKIIQIALQRKMHEKNSLEQKKLLSTSLDSLPHPFYMINAETHEIIFANKATSDMNIQPGTTCYNVIYNRNIPCDGKSCTLAAVKKTGKPVIMEHLHYEDDGKHRNVEVHGYPVFDKEGNVSHMIEYILDITDKKDLLNKLELEKQRAESSDKLKSQFLANMSHEIRTPLNSIIGFLELTIDNDDLKDKYKEYVGYSLESGKLLLALINDILDLSKIEAGQLEIENVPFSLKQVMDSVMSSARVLLSEKKRIELRFTSSAGIKDDLTGDSFRLEQILNNLISNAIKFTSSGFIECGVSLLDKKTLEFYVRDSGVGIEDDKINRIFSPFQQAESNTTRKYGGTGLGLTITKHLIELMEGRIRVKSQKGEGSSFFFTLPYSVAPGTSLYKSETRGSEGQEAHSKIKTILVAEDELTNQKLLEHILSKKDYLIRIAGDGRDAVSIYKTDSSIDAVLMDIGMPHLSGIDAVRVIRDFEKKNNKKKIPIFAVTAFAMKGDRERCFNAGFDEYLTKPLDQKLLLTTLEKYL